MQIDFHYIHTEKTEALEVHARKSFSTLEHLISGLDPDGAARLKLEFVRSTQHHHKGLVYEVRVQLDLLKKVFNAEAGATDMHTALDEAKHKLMRLVERYKEQARDSHRVA